MAFVEAWIKCNFLKNEPVKHLLFCQVVIAANYGLGESVVAATSDPDTITVSRDFWTVPGEEQLSVSGQQVGTKKSKVVAATGMS